MDRYFAVIGERLDGENPNVVATQPPPRGAEKRNVMARRGVVARESSLPAIVARLTGEYWRVEIPLQPTRAGAPDIEVAITPRLHAEKHRNQQPDQHEWQGRSLRARKGRRQRDAHRNDCPIGRIVEPRSPDRRAIDFAAVEMSDGAHFGGIECVSGLCFVGNHKRHDGPPVVRTMFLQMTGIDSGAFISSTPMNRSGIATMLTLSRDYQHQVQQSRGAPQYPDLPSSDVTRNPASRRLRSAPAPSQPGRR